MNPPLFGSLEKVWCTASFDGVMCLVSVGTDPDRAFLVFPTVPGDADPKRYREIMGMIEKLEAEGLVEQTRQAPSPLQELAQRDLCYKGRAEDLFRLLSRNGIEIKVSNLGKLGSRYGDLALIVSELGPWIAHGAGFTDAKKFVVINPARSDVAEAEPRGGAHGKAASAERAGAKPSMVSRALGSVAFLRCARVLGLPFFTLCMSGFGLLIVLRIDAVAGIVGVVLAFACLSLVAYRTESV